MITIFQVITMEGWSEIMYIIDDTSGNIITAPYFCLIIIIGSFFLLNLILAVIMRVFTQNDELEKIKKRNQKILEETKKLRKNANYILAPLKVIKVKRSKSATYRKKFKALELNEYEDGDSVKKIPCFKHVTSNFLELNSPKKLIKKAMNDSSN